MKKRKAIGKIILALVFAFLIGITIWAFGLKEGLFIWAVGFGISAIIIIAMYLIMEGE